MLKKAKDNMFGFLEKLTSNKFNLLLVSISLAWIVALLMVLSRAEAWGDDIWFAEHVRSLSLLEWVAYRWENWSSRILPEALLWIFAPESRILWVLASGLVYAVYIFILYKFFLLFSTKNSRSIYLVALLLICASIWLLASATFLDSVLWLTGSINYFWMGVLFLIGIYTPFYIIIKNSTPHYFYVILSITATLITAVSHEQFGLSLVAINAVVTALYYLNSKLKFKKILTNKKFVVLLTLLVSSLVLLVLSLTAPGNSIRAKLETKTWLPDFHIVDPATRAESSIRWFNERLINHSGVILIAIWFILSISLRPRYPILALFFAGIVILSLLYILSPAEIAISQLPFLGYLFQFNATWGFRGSPTTWIPVIFWLFTLTVTLIGIYKSITNTTLRTLAIALPIIAAMSLAALWLSPTMYASGYRVVFASNILLILLSTLLAPQLLAGSQFDNESKATVLRKKSVNML